jgi:hypothetical protein
MPATLTIDHPVISQMPQTYLALASNVGDPDLIVQNSAPFSVNQYVVVGQYANPITQTLLITAPNTNNTTIVTVPAFPYPVDTPITLTPFNEIRIYRSLTGIGGTYSLIATVPIEVDQQVTTFTDFSSVSPYSYKYTYHNSFLNIETAFSSEIPYAGFPLSSLQSIGDRTLSIFVDSQGEYITRDDIANWTNELCGHLNREVTDSDNQSFANYVTFTPGTAEYTDITTYGFEAIMLVEYSTDGINYLPINPMDSRFSSKLNPTSQYSWRLIDQKLFIYGNFPSTQIVRMWGYTQQPVLSLGSDQLPIVYRSYSDVFVDYCMMRASEKSRRLQESAVYYGKKFNIGFLEIIDATRSRINQGNQSMAITWLPNFNGF